MLASRHPLFISHNKKSTTHVIICGGHTFTQFSNPVRRHADMMWITRAHNPEQDPGAVCVIVWGGEVWLRDHCHVIVTELGSRPLTNTVWCRITVTAFTISVTMDMDKQCYESWNLLSFIWIPESYMYGFDKSNCSSCSVARSILLKLESILNDRSIRKCKKFTFT